uniref:Arginyl-tRNA--protein transferase 1 n=1 Tax=Timema californicum TaxID=61474 RepID=A0A7R9P9G9_TIMCA|nr:unnamed protein product [Timema californicum]
MWAHNLTVTDYQDLIDRGWRRSGLYCYKPTMNLTCCPLYTIRCAALEFKLSKSQKKVLKRMHRFLSHGNTKSNEGRSETPEIMDVCPVMDIPGLHEKALKAERDAESLKVLSVDSTITEKKGHAQSPSQDNCIPGPTLQSPRGENKDQPISKTGAYVDITSMRPPCKKAKFLRLERKQKKLLSQGFSEKEVESMTRRGKSLGNKEKSLENFLNEPLPPNPAHRLELLSTTGDAPLMAWTSSSLSPGTVSLFLRHVPIVVRLVRSNPPSQELEQTYQEAYQVYLKYQMAVHGDSAEKCTLHQYTRFLVKSPLKVVLVAVASPEFKRSADESYALFVRYQFHIHQEKDDKWTYPAFEEFLVDSPLAPWQPQDGPPQGYGSFHQQYWLSGRLVAVGVIDILPRCISSVYFYYDPDLGHLSLGTYASLRELALTQSLYQHAPSLQYYYMGFYIQTCPKMRYKAGYTPSFLLCPETYQWFPVEVCRPKLEVNKYCRFNDDLAATDCDSEININEVLVLRRHVAMPYFLYASKYQLEPEDLREVEQYARLVGMSCARRMLLVRN